MIDPAYIWWEAVLENILHGIPMSDEKFIEVVEAVAAAQERYVNGEPG
jgi:hypothetical protein